jgi:2-methylcitrate dehydratase PrpD
MGFTGVEDVLEGDHNALEAHSTEPRPEEMARDLGTRYYVTETAIKTFSVGYPIQAALDAFLTLRREHGITVDSMDRIIATLPEDGARIVDDRSMPDVNLQYLIAVALIDGTVSFDASHSYERMKDAQVVAAKRRVELVADRAMMDPAAPRSAKVEVRLRDGRTVSHFTRHAPGTKENPLDGAGVNAKARSLIEPVLGARRTAAIIERVDRLDALGNVRELGSLLRE